MVALRLIVQKLKILFIFAALLCFVSINFAADDAVDVSERPPRVGTPRYVRGIHVTKWAAATRSMNEGLISLVEETELNTMVVTVKEVCGKMSLPDIAEAIESEITIRTVRNWKAYIDNLRRRGIYPVARIAVFKDNAMAHARPCRAILNPEGGVWTDLSGSGWLDPYNRENWNYVITVAEKAAYLGFEEIQWDFVRFPSCGNLADARYSAEVHNAQTRSDAITGFLRYARQRLAPLDVKISICVFGLTTTSRGDMGIGQRIVEMARYADFISPMMYPSHYARGTYGIEHPNAEPYPIIFIGLEGAIDRGILVEKLRPWYQDFSLFGVRYCAEKVRAQIQAGYDVGVGSWLLWNPACRFTREALLGPEESDRFEVSYPPTPLMVRRQERLEALQAEQAQ